MAASAMVFYAARIRRADCHDHIVRQWWGDSDIMMADGGLGQEPEYLFIRASTPHASCWSDDRSFAQVPGNPSEAELEELVGSVAEIVKDPNDTEVIYGWWLRCNR